MIHDQLVKMFHLKAICGLVGQVGFTCTSEEASKVNVNFETIQIVKCINKFNKFKTGMVSTKNWTVHITHLG